jgi:hypothetical protein
MESSHGSRAYLDHHHQVLLLLLLLLLLMQVLARRDWRCPCCRDICNCSGQNCQRSRRGLKDTKMLWHEARNLGYKSVRVLDNS